MNAPKLILNDGTEYELDWCNGDRGIFYGNIVTEDNIIQLATKFSDPENTRHIVAEYGAETILTYDGYTQLRSISFDSWRTGTVMIALTMPGA